MTEVNQSATLEQACITWNGTTLEVTNDAFRRTWTLTGAGLATTRLTDGDHTWVDCTPAEGDCDWSLFRMTRPGAPAQLVGVTVQAVEDPPRVWPHVLAVVRFVYPETDMSLHYTVQAFPCAPGVRTQISVRALRPMGKEDIPSYLLQSFGDRLVMNPARYRRRAVGYYNDAQHRNHDDTPMMKRGCRTGALAEGRREVIDWANLLSLEHDKGGLVLVKESNKCANQQGIDTGAFVLTDDAVRVTGLGLTDNNYHPKEPWLPHERRRESWATWCVPYRGDDSARQLAVKRFDRARFQRKPEHGARSRSNTWGTRSPGFESRAAAEQENVIKEIASCAELGIDAVAIDDGWQWPIDGSPQRPEHGWRPDPERFPTGWLAVREAAERAGVELNLWLPGAGVTLEQIIRNIEHGGFTGLKVDFLRFSTRDQMEEVVERVRRAVEHTGGRLEVSWDVTEESPRVGYYVGREFGSLHTSNRKGTYPGERVRHIAYTPRLVLRDAWHLSHYINLNQIEIPVQDPMTVDPEIGNASCYPHDYCTAMSVAGLPLFFQETHVLEGDARTQTRTVMQAWRQHRRAMASGFAFPIGDEPCDAAWTGFQLHNPDTGTGYVLVFRELDAPQNRKALPMHLVDDVRLAWEDVLNGSTWTDEAPRGAVECTIEVAPGFRWLRYHPA